jgi:opacity protein-like surface antigen
MKKIFGSIVLGLALSSAALWGEPMIDFSGAGFSGTISSAGFGSAVAGSSVFYDGTITDTGSGYLAAFQGAGGDSKNPDLIAYNTTALSTDVVNTAAPEPSAILLLGSGLLLIGGLLRRKMNRQRAIKRAD